VAGAFRVQGRTKPRTARRGRTECIGWLRLLARKDSTIEPEPFAITRDTLDAAEVVTIVGELDMAHAPAVGDLLDELAGSGNPVVVDLTALSFIDSSGIHALLRQRPQEATLELVCPAGNVRRVLEVTKLERVLRVHDTLDEALAAAA
jgi:anti-sigma B factor antagonist